MAIVRMTRIGPGPLASKSLMLNLRLFSRPSIARRPSLAALALVVLARSAMPPPPVIAAATSCDKLQLRKLCEGDKSRVHAVGPNGNSPLHCAVAKETAAAISAVKILLEFGADPGAENDHGDTPLSIAKGKGYNKFLPLLEEAAVALAAKEAEEKRKKAEAKAAKKAAANAASGAAGSSVG